MYPYLYNVLLSIAKRLVIMACNCRDKGQGKHAYMRRRVINELERNLGVRP